MLDPFRLVELADSLFRREAVLLVDLIAITVDTILTHTDPISCNLVVVVNEAASFLEDIKECGVGFIGLVDSLHPAGFILSLLVFLLWASITCLRRFISSMSSCGICMDCFLSYG